MLDVRVYNTNFQAAADCRYLVVCSSVPSTYRSFYDQNDLKHVDEVRFRNRSALHKSAEGITAGVGSIIKSYVPKARAFTRAVENPVLGVSVDSEFYAFRE